MVFALDEKKKTMNRKPYFLPVFLLAAVGAGPASAQSTGSMLRIGCDGDAANAEVTINGKFRGECPLDVQVPSGTLQLHVLKKVDASRERVFTQEMRIGDGTVKRIDVQLGPTQLNAEGMRREAERTRLAQEDARRREEARQLALAEEKRRDAALLVQQQKAAEAGDQAAMMALGDRHASGAGLEKNEALAGAWYGRAAVAGNEAAAFKLSPVYKTGKKADVDDVVRILSLPVEQQRDVALKDEAGIRAFIDSDPFFATPTGGQRISYSPKFLEGVRSTHNCGGNGRYAQVDTHTQVQDITANAEMQTILGGLVPVKGKDSQGMFKNTRFEISKIASVHGQPFPLAPGKRFGIAFAMSRSGNIIGDGVSTDRLSCTVDKEVSALSLQTSGAKVPVVCLHKQDHIHMLKRVVWHEAAGCFAVLSIKILEMP